MEFLVLTQGDKTVVEYEVAFSRLAKFAPRLVPDQESKASNLKKG